MSIYHQTSCVLKQESASTGTHRHKLLTRRLSPPWANLQPLSERCKLMVTFQMSEVGASDCTNKRAILQSGLFSVCGGGRLRLRNITAGAQRPQLQRWDGVNVVFNTIICELGCSVFHEGHHTVCDVLVGQRPSQERMM